ncbi:MAG: APC family permease, partial [Methylocystaceae bacterium]
NLENFGYKQELKRTLPFRDVLVYGMIFMVPIAPMGIYGFVAKDASGMVPLVYLVGIFAMIFTALSYARMSEQFPISGSVYAYVQHGLNPHIGFLAGWVIMMDYIVTPALLYSMSGTWLSSLLPGSSPWIWVLLFIAVNTWINIRGIEFTAKANMVMLFIELAALAIFVVAGLFFVIKGGGAGGLTLAPFYQPGKVDLGFIATATSIAVLSFLGFDAISTLAEETNDAQKMIGKATITALIVMGLIFILQTYVAAIVVPDATKFKPDTAFFDIAGVAAGVWFKNILTIVNIIAVGIANTLAAQAGMSRILYSMSRDKSLPAVFSKVHPKYKTPYIATLFVAVFSILVLVVTSLKIDMLSKFVNFGALTSFMVLNFTVFWFFFIKQKQHNLFKYLILPWAGILVIGFVWFGFDPLTKIVGFIWLGIGIIYGAIMSKGYKVVPDAFKNAKF